MERDTINQENYKKALTFCNHGTMLRLFELEGCKIDDFVERGVKDFASHSLGIRAIDSTHTSFGDSRGNIKAKIYSKFEKTTDVIDYLDLNTEFVRVKLLEQILNVYSSTVIYIELHKKSFNL